MSRPLSPVLPPAPRLVAIGGLDPGGGAGLVRDAATARSLGAAVVLVGTAWTDQSRHAVRGFEPRDPAGLRHAARAALAQAGQFAAAVKIGMVATPELVDAILGALEEAAFRGPVVFDPVLAASSGGALFRGPPACLLPLVRRATLTTPNLGEAAALAGLPVTGLAEASAAARSLVAAGAPAVLVKGGHLQDRATDLLVTAAAEQRFTADRVPGPSPRGTGCALATALAIELGRGQPLAQAVACAKAWLHARIRGARQVGDELHLGE